VRCKMKGRANVKEVGYNSNHTGCHWQMADEVQ
jgi:hypothetical protein